MGECNHETTDQILDYFYESGGNFIDTSNAYQVPNNETSYSPIHVLTNPVPRGKTPRSGLESG